MSDEMNKNCYAIFYKKSTSAMLGLLKGLKGSWGKRVIASRCGSTKSSKINREVNLSTRLVVRAAAEPARQQKHEK